MNDSPTPNAVPPSIPQMRLFLPQFTFINAPAGSGKTTLAQLLCAQDSGICHMSFAEPIRLALCATFYPDRPIDPPNLRDGAVKASLIPGTNVTHRDWMVAYSNFMKGLLGPYIFGDLAKRTASGLGQFYPRFVFDDSRYTQEIDPFSSAFGRDDCLMIHIERTGHLWNTEKFDLSGRGNFFTYVGARHVVISNNGSESDMLDQLARALT